MKQITVTREAHAALLEKKAKLVREQNKSISFSEIIVKSLQGGI